MKVRVIIHIVVAKGANGSLATTHTRPNFMKGRLLATYYSVFERS